VKHYLLTESDFADIQQNLENHILEEMERIGTVLDGCGVCDVPYFQQPDNFLNVFVITQKW